MLFIAYFDNLLTERESGSKGVEMLTGLSLFVYWITTAFVDYIFYVYILTHTSLIFYVMGTVEGAATPNKMRDLYDVLYFYGCAQYFFVAALSQAMPKHYTPDTWIIIAAVNAVCVCMYLFRKV